MAAFNFIVMVVSALWFVAHLDRHAKRGRKRRNKFLSSQTRLFHSHRQ